MFKLFRKSDRRDFIKTLFGGIAVSFVPLPKVEGKTLPPTTTILGRELNTPKLLEEGWHTVKLVGLEMRPSKSRPEDMLVHFKLETVFGEKQILHKFVSQRAPMFAIDFFKRLGLPVESGQVNLNDAIGKELKVKVEKTTYMNREVNRVE